MVEYSVGVLPKSCTQGTLKSCNALVLLQCWGVLLLVGEWKYDYGRAASGALDKVCIVCPKWEKRLSLLARVHYTIWGILYGVMKMDVDALLRNEKLLGRVIVTRHEFLWGAWRTKKLILPLSCRKGWTTKRLEYTEDHSYIFGAPSDPKRTCLIWGKTWDRWLSMYSFLFK